MGAWIFVTIVGIYRTVNAFNNVKTAYSNVTTADTSLEVALVIVGIFMICIGAITCNLYENARNRQEILDELKKLNKKLEQ